MEQSMFKRLLFLSASLISSIHAMDNAKSQPLQEWVKNETTVTVILGFPTMYIDMAFAIPIDDKTAIYDVKLDACRELNQFAQGPFKTIYLVARYCSDYLLQSGRLDDSSKIKTVMNEYNTNIFELIYKQ